MWVDLMVLPLATWTVMGVTAGWMSVRESVEAK
jgi:hypothetical protein